MLQTSFESARAPKTLHQHADLVIVGGGMAGTCCAITAARAGIKVILVQDRPVLGGNASSEVRLWILGATSHMGNNNRWAREGGVIDEILVENLYRNPEGNGIILDTILLEKVMLEANITLLLNTAVYEVSKSSPDTIESVTAFCSQNSTRYVLSAPLFCDASGDGIIGFQAGAAFRMGAESAEEFDEPFAPTKEYGELLGHSLYFMTKDVGKPIKFVAPDYALKDITQIPRYRKFNTRDHGCFLWWLEYGGRLDTVHDTEKIKWELWKVVYGVWDYIKNSGEFPEAETMTLEWVGHIPGKRESRRFEGHYMLKQSDLVGQKRFEDAVSFGGWAIDLHPADGVFSEKPGCNQWHSKGVYQVPYRSMISRNISNLFLAGRIISASHVAFGSTRVMATCAHNAQAVAVAAALAIKNEWLPADLTEVSRMKMLQQELLKTGQYIPHVHLEDRKDLVGAAHIHARHGAQKVHAIQGTAPDISLDVAEPNGRTDISSSALLLEEIPFDGGWQPLDQGVAQLLPMSAGPVPECEVELNASEATQLTVTFRTSSQLGNFTPDIIHETHTVDLQAGIRAVRIPFSTHLPEAQYGFICFHAHEALAIRTSHMRATGILTVYNKFNRAVSNFGRQEPEPGMGFEAFEFWTPKRRPEGQNIAMRIRPGLDCFGVENLTNGMHRPVLGPNAWVADLNDPTPTLELTWNQPQTIGRILLTFDTDTDHPMESTLWGHPERQIPFTVEDYQIFDEHDNLMYSRENNHQTRNEIVLEAPVKTSKLTIQLKRPADHIPVALFGIRCYSDQ